MLRPPVAGTTCGLPKRIHCRLNLPQVQNLREVMEAGYSRLRDDLQAGVLFSIEPQFAVDAIPVGYGAAGDYDPNNQGHTHLRPICPEEHP